MNQRGFATMTLLILMPLLLAALALIACAYLVVRVDSRARHSCRTELLRSQAEIAKDLEALIAMNPEAKLLRRERELADQAAKSRHPVALGIQAVVIAKQVLFKTKQLAHLARGTVRSLTDPQRAFAKLRAISAVDSAKLSGRSEPARFDVIASPKKSLTPDYNPSPLFQQRQVMRLTWSFPAASVTPKWLHQFIQTERAVAEGTCAVTLEKKGKQWLPKITADRF